MGFEPGESKTALTICNGDVEAAANYLMNRDEHERAQRRPSLLLAGAGGDSKKQPGYRTVHATTSQYTYDDGRSACTCMALMAASAFLEAQPHEASDLITTEWIDAQLEAGLQLYQSTPNKSTDHTSAEQFYGLLPNLHLIGGGIQQGINSPDPSHPQGLHRLIHECQPTMEGWSCVVMTKPPETVLLLLPSSSSSHQLNNNNNFGLIDSHPRDDTPCASAKLYNRLEDLIVGVLQLFPYVELDDTVPDLYVCIYHTYMCVCVCCC